MNNAKQKTKVKDKSDGNLTEELNQFALRCENAQTTDLQPAETPSAISAADAESDEAAPYQKQVSDAVKVLFDRCENEEFFPKDFQTDIPVASLESKVGYTSLIRQMHHAFVKRVA